MDDFERAVLSDLSALKSQMGSLIGLGQPGRLALLEERIDRHEVYLQRTKGLMGALIILMTAAHILVDYLRR